ncbi:hypothetical protein HDU96_009148 [Phlyctochytrium bullatum]|nr:hypothetical protein HDU96_009148 [Phlyctochytrium bullatum]
MHPFNRLCDLLPTPTDPRTEHDMMLAGELHYGSDPHLTALHARARVLCAKLNRLDDCAANHPDRMKVFGELIGSGSEAATIESPFRCDYGSNIHLGKRVYINSNVVILDSNKVTIGDDVLIAPAVQIYTAYHPLEPELRTDPRGPEYAKAVTIGNGVWIGGAAIILPGVTIGDGAVVGAGSVVTKDVDPRTVVAGNPARVVRRIS